jgi:hypothetical protein
MLKTIEIQGIFYWTGTEWKRLKKIGYMKYTRDRKVFFALNCPNASDLMLPQLAESMIIDIIIDEGLESEYLITDPQKVNHGLMMPATEQEITNYPGYCVWVGYVDIPRYARFSEPGEHNITIKVAPRKKGGTGRDFSPKRGGVIKTFTYEILDDKLPE